MVSKAIKGMATTLFVDDIENLSTYQCEQLQCGDVVVLEDNGEKHAFVVSSKEYRSSLVLSYTNSTYISIVKYEFDDGAWAFDETINTTIEQEISQAVGNKATVWKVDDITSQGAISSQMKVGDIIYDNSLPAYLIISHISFNNGSLSVFVSTGSYTDRPDPVNITFVNGEWNEYNCRISITDVVANEEDNGKFLQVQEDGTVAPATVSGGTKLYQHDLEVQVSGQSTHYHFTAITTGSNLFTVQGGPPRLSTTDNIISVSESSRFVFVYGSDVISYAFNISSKDAISLIGCTLISDTVTEL